MDPFQCKPIIEILPNHLSTSSYNGGMTFDVFLFSILHKQGMDIWEMVGLWHYPIPGFFLLAQFCLGVLVALGNLVNNSVFLYISDEEDHQTSNGDATPEGNTVLNYSFWV